MLKSFTLAPASKLNGWFIRMNTMDISKVLGWYIIIMFLYRKREKEERVVGPSLASQKVKVGERSDHDFMQ